MKKLMILGVVAAGLVTFASCKKDRVCTCTATSTGSGADFSVSGDTTYVDISKKDAESKCDSNEGTVTFGEATISTTCELK
jgi:hypothetical protein